MALTQRRLVLIVLFAAAVHLLLGLDARTLWVPDEGRYAEIAREMAVTGDWIVPRLNGARYFEKPPLVYWMTAASLAIFGRTEWAARLPVALMGIMGLVATYFLARRMIGERAGLCAIVILATNPFYFALSRFLVLDMALAALVTAGLACVWWAVEPLPDELAGGGVASGRPRGDSMLLWASGFFGLATLTKGPIGVVLPVMILAPLIVFAEGRRMVVRAPWFRMIAVYALVTVPWFVAVIRRHPEFAGFFFIHEHLDRFLKPTHSRPGPFWYFVPVLLFGFFPWSCFLPGCVRRTPGLIGLRRWFLWAWAIVPFLFFSVSKSKLPAYVLPILPPLAILVAHRLVSLLEESSDADGCKSGGDAPVSALPYWVMAACLCGSALSLLLIAESYRLSPIEYPDLCAVRGSIATVLCALACGGLALAGLARTGRARLALALLAIGAAFTLHLAEIIAKKYEVEKDVKSFAKEIRSRLAPGDRVLVYGPLEAASALPFYLDRLVVVGSHHWGELTFAHDTMQPDERAVFLGPGPAQVWMEPGSPRGYFITNHGVYDDYFARLKTHRLIEISRRGDLVLFTNR